MEPIYVILYMWIPCLVSSSSLGDLNPLKLQSNVPVISQSGLKTAINGPNCDCRPFYECDGFMNSSFGSINELFDIHLDKDSPCDDYIDVCCNSKVVAIPEKPNIDQHVPQCGQRNFNGIFVRILGAGFPDGEAQFAEFPWMAAILRESNGRKIYTSGGALIHPNIILTTAHRIYPHIKSGDDFIVRLGEWDSKSTKEFFKHQDISVKNIIIHENFDDFNLINDFALLILEKPATIGPHVDTICLPTGQGIYDVNRCVAMGWGKDGFIDGAFQNILKHVELPLLTNDFCQNQLRQTRLGSNFTLDPSFVCAGGESGRDTCRGDGGSPLVCPLLDDPGRFEIVGMVAWGIGCGMVGVPGVYANINSETTLGWILTKVHPFII